MKTNYIVKAGIIAAIYVVLTILLGELSYGPIQFRISEALVLLPLVENAAIPGVFIGCMLANIFGGLGPLDIFGGSLITLIAAYLTSKVKNRYVGMVPPILLNAMGVPLILLFTLPKEAIKYGYWGTALSIAFSEAVVLTIFGLPILYLYQKFNKK
ncbi:MAG: QueT transporter family protein [Clostridia bacterium]|nr:QueT transporter family protein [Clostridia bacterium]